MNMTKLETIEELEVLVEKNERMFFLNIVRHARLVTVHTQNFKRIAVKKEKCQRITYTYKMREMCQIVLQNNTVLDMNHRKCYT